MKYSDRPYVVKDYDYRDKLRHMRRHETEQEAWEHFISSGPWYVCKRRLDYHVRNEPKIEVAVRWWLDY